MLILTVIAVAFHVRRPRNVKSTVTIARMYPARGPRAYMTWLWRMGAKITPMGEEVYSSGGFVKNNGAGNSKVYRPYLFAEEVTDRVLPIV